MTSEGTSRDPYVILGVQRGASKEEIRAAYHCKVKGNHPDIVPEKMDEDFKAFAHERMTQINWAYHLLIKSAVVSKG